MVGYGTLWTNTDGAVSCQEAFDQNIRLPPENCTAWQSLGEYVCRCAAEPPERHDCPLCDDGDSLPEGALAAIPGTFCAQLQVDATRDSQDRCPIWQQTMGNYCGCNNTYDASICRLCKEGSKFDPVKVVNGLDNTAISCGRLEFSANLESGDFGCNEYQFMYESQCCEKIDSPGERQNCTLCDDGGPLPDGALAAIPGTFCTQLQVDALNATRYFQDQCPIWQQTMGNYCGCNNTYDASICRLCKEGYKFDPAKVVNSLDKNTAISCGRLEFSVNLASGDSGCQGYQFIFESQCCEKIEEDEESGAMGSSVIGLVVIAIFGAWKVSV